MKNKEEKLQHEYRIHELEIVTPILAKLGYILDLKQPHISGERFLMRAVTTVSGKKLILLGSRKKDGKRVVIKITNDKNGIKELIHEKESKKILEKIDFAYHTFLSPKEILFEKHDDYLISINEFIEQKCTFLERKTEEQFSFALKAFKAQEGAHATTYKHEKTIKKTFDIFGSIQYIDNFKEFIETTKKNIQDKSVLKILENGKGILNSNKDTIDQYCGFLTHTDFVPHNFRIAENDIYLLDHSSLRFGNKYEGWARFLNFMALYNPKLESGLLYYINENRAKEEQLSLKSMRVYRLGEIIAYYSNTLSKTSDDLNSLNLERVKFWSKILNAVINDTSVDKKVIDDYKKLRDKLRSDEEKERQIGLH